MGNSPVPGEFPTQRPVTRSFDAFFDLRLNKRLSKQWWGWWFVTLSRPLWRHRYVALISAMAGIQATTWRNWIIVIWVIQNKLQANFRLNFIISIKENTFLNTVCKMSDISFRPQLATLWMSIWLKSLSFDNDTSDWQSNQPWASVTWYLY